MKRISCIQFGRRYAFTVGLLTIAKLLSLRVGEGPVNVTITKAFSGPANLRGVMHMLLDMVAISCRLHIKKWYQQNLDHERPREYKPMLLL